MITLLYLHDIPVDALSLKLFDGSGLVATVAMEAVPDGDRACLWSGTLSDVPANSTMEWEACENGGSQKVAWGTATGFIDGVTVRLDEDRSIPISNAIDRIEESQEEQGLQLDGQDIDLATLLDQTEHILKPTVAGRTLNVDASGNVQTEAEIGELSAEAIEQLKEILQINVTVAPTSVQVPPDVKQDTIYLRLDDTSEYSVTEVTGSNGTALNLTLYESLELLLESRDKQQLEILSVSVINEGRGFKFQPTTLTVGAETVASAPHLWALRNPDDAGETGVGRVLAGGPLVVTRFATRRGVGA